MPNKKDRRNSGRKQALLTISKKEALQNNLEPVNYWDDWLDWRDGMRINSDKTMIRSKFAYFAKSENVIKYNNKIKKQIIIRRRKKKMSL